MKRARLSWLTVQLLSCFLQTLAFLDVRLTQVLQGETGYWIIQTLGSAQRAVAVSSPLSPVLLQTGCTEAVAALEDHRVLEDFTAYGAGEVDLWEREPASHVLTQLPLYSENESRAKGQLLIKHRESLYSCPQTSSLFTSPYEDCCTKKLCLKCLKVKRTTFRHI